MFLFYMRSYILECNTLLLSDNITNVNHPLIVKLEYVAFLLEFITNYTCPLPGITSFEGPMSTSINYNKIATKIPIFANWGG